jgi:hypothetical protein
VKQKKKMEKENLRKGQVKRKKRTKKKRGEGGGQDL